MKAILRNDLIPVNLLSILLILIITFFPSNVLRIILGLPFIFFSPGYITVAFLFPKKNSLSIIERIALSIGLSIVIVTLIGFGLSYSPWGIDLYPVLVSITIFTIVASALVWYRRHKVSGEKN